MGYKMTQRGKVYVRKAFLRGWLQSKDEEPAKQITRKEHFKQRVQHMQRPWGRRKHEMYLRSRKEAT